MTYFLLILFFTSLVSIVFMVWRRMVLIKNGNYYIQDESSFEVPYLKEAINVAFAGIKKYEHKGLVIVVKFYIQASNFLKNKFKEFKNKIQNIHVRNHSTGELIEKVEASKFLKIVSSYKHKITEITHKIKQEEKDL